MRNFPSSALGAISDGVAAIALTIIVLGINFPTVFDAGTINMLFWNIFLFFESFCLIAGFWYLQRLLIANFTMVAERDAIIHIFILFLFCLIPLFTRGIMQTPDSVFPVVGYGIVILLVTLLMNVVMYTTFVLEIPKADRKAKVVVSKNGLFFHYILVPLVLIAITVLGLFWPQVAASLFFLYTFLWWIINVVWKPRVFRIIQ